jgi:hypothetical protein
MTAPADGRGGSTPPRPAPGGGSQPGQWFVLRPWLFDVTAATSLLRRVPRPAQPLPVMAWARAYGLIPGPGRSPHAVPLIGPGPGFKPGYALTTSLDDPVIIASITATGSGPPAPLLIDGCHRLYKAAQLGREHLPCLVLTAEETLSIRRPAILMPGHGPARRQVNSRGTSPNHDHSHHLA